MAEIVHIPITERESDVVALTRALILEYAREDLMADIRAAWAKYERVVERVTS
jgi:hypothetical protein